MPDRGRSRTTPIRVRRGVTRITTDRVRTPPLRSVPYQLVAEYHEVMSHALAVPKLMMPASQRSWTP